MALKARKRSFSFQKRNCVQAANELCRAIDALLRASRWKDDPRWFIEKHGQPGDEYCRKLHSCMLRWYQRLGNADSAAISILCLNLAETAASAPVFLSSEKAEKVYFKAQALKSAVMDLLQS